MLPWDGLTNEIWKALPKKKPDFDLSNARLFMKSIPLYTPAGGCLDFKTGDYFSFKLIFKKGL
jgi:hypothetical protein